MEPTKMAKSNKRSTPKNTQVQPVAEVIKPVTNNDDNVLIQPYETLLTEGDRRQLVNYIHFVVEYRMNELNYQKYNFWDSWIMGVITGTFLGIATLAGSLYLGNHYLTFL